MDSVELLRTEHVLGEPTTLRGGIFMFTGLAISTNSLFRPTGGIDFVNAQNPAVEWLLPSEVLQFAI